ncbi:MAG TPA: CotH kinase family protein [Tepidisphaeraceae bacterium]|nr:CotH kinase family protein [Tepidisphaeraceae bacterium]
MRHSRVIALFIGLLCVTTARCGVVINEIFYHAPNDLDDVQWMELFNSGDQPVDISGWSLDQGKLYTFPKETAIAAQGYVVVAFSTEQFRQNYGITAAGPFKRPLKRGGEQIELANARGERVDLARYKDHEPWPVSPDGYSASLERICPTVSGEMAENWSASPLPIDTPRPAGTPGKKNASYCAVLPPSIKIISPIVDDSTSNQPLNIEIEAKDPAAIKELTLFYRTVAEGLEGKETAKPIDKDPATGQFSAAIPGQGANTLVRYRIKVTGDGVSRFYPAENDLCPAFSTYIHEPWKLGKIPFGLIVHGNQPRGIRGIRGFLGGGQPSADARPPRGSSAFVHVNEKTGKTTLFDFVNINERRGGRGFKVHFHKDNTLNGMTAISIIFEGNERFLMAEAMAYDLYRRAGNAAPLADFLRLSVDGRMAGYHLMVENPNRSFIRRNKVDDSGNLYKIRWFGRGIVGQHEKKTNLQSGHDDLIAVVEQLRKTRGDEQWKVIQENFNVNQVATYFAVNMVLSHWDGYFNNYYTYHDPRKNKWEMYPWDQDKTWGFFDGIGGDEVFFDMPLTFGMEGDPRPPENGRGGGNPFGGGPAWWRPGGYFSSPLLANPQFRAIFLARVKEILDKNYNEAVYIPLLKEMAARLKDDVVLRARMHGNDAGYAAEMLEHNIQSLQTHLLKRRAFLLDQPELRGLDKTTAPADNKR